jgi:hypothetical protein
VCAWASDVAYPVVHPAATAAELQAPEHGDLACELVNTRLTVLTRPDELPHVQATRGQPDTEPVIHKNLHARRVPVGKQISVVRPCRAEHLRATRKDRIDARAARISMGSVASRIVLPTRRRRHSKAAFILVDGQIVVVGNVGTRPAIEVKQRHVIRERGRRNERRGNK